MLFRSERRDWKNEDDLKSIIPKSCGVWDRELKRRTKVVGVFPNEESLLRLAGSIPMDINEEWVTGRKYLTMEGE